jgi:uncharacterized protein YabE (DUF348 family)/3D (Asp-Asp-Asp) domain-containing protein
MNILRLVGWLLIVAALIIAGAAAWTYFENDEFTLLIDGDSATVEGKFDSVNDLLVASGIELTRYDIVHPPLDSPVNDGDTVSIQRANSVTVTNDEESTLYWTHNDKLAPFLAEIEIELSPSYKIAVDGVPVSYEGLAGAELPSEISFTKTKSVTLIDNGSPQIVSTDLDTVGELLDMLDVSLLKADSISAQRNDWLIPNSRIEITRTDPVVIAVDGEQITLRTDGAATGMILEEAGIALGELDYTIPGLDYPVEPGNVIKVVRVSEELYYEDEPIPYESVFQATDTLEIDQRALLSSGEPGVKRRQIRVRFEDGVEVSRVVDSEWVEKEPINEVTGYGTQIVIRTLDTPDGPYEYWRAVRMRVTAYTASSSGKPPEHPAYGITASGVSAGTGVVAIDPKVVPFRSWIYVPGYGIGYAGDTGGGVKGRWIDLGYDEEELVAWNGYTDVYYLTPVPPESRINYLIPTYLP